MSTIVKVTSKGQITLPAKWRRSFRTDQFIIEEKNNGLVVMPLILEKDTVKKEYTVFDALRDNKGKGIKAKDFVRLLKKMV